MNAIGIIGLLSGLLGIVGFFFPVEWKKKSLIKITFTILLLSLSGYIAFLNSKIDRIERISRSANLLIQSKETNFTSEGFILAALSFLEQNKNDFPESYERAKLIFNKYNGDESRSMNSVHTSFEMEGLIRGISILSTVDEVSKA